MPRHFLLPFPVLKLAWTGVGSVRTSDGGGEQAERMAGEASERWREDLGSSWTLPCHHCGFSAGRGRVATLPKRIFCAARADLWCLSVSGDPRFPSHLFLEQRSPPPPPPPPTLLSNSHPVPAPSPLPFTQPGPAFSQQGQQPVFPRDRPVRPALQPPGPVGLLHFSQPGSAAARPFLPPRQPFLPGPGQPFLPAHAQPSLQVRGPGSGGGGGRRRCASRVSEDGVSRFYCSLLNTRVIQRIRLLISHALLTADSSVDRIVYFFISHRRSGKVSVWGK